MKAKDVIKGKAAQEWRGIESAPKDGTWVLVIDSEYGDHGGAFVARYTEAFSGCWLINTSHIPHIVYPTHWQPLPTPPQEHAMTHHWLDEDLGCNDTPDIDGDDAVEM